MRFMHSTGGAAQDDTESETVFTANASDPAAPTFKADWIEVTNGGSEILLASPYGSMEGATPVVGVVIPPGKTFRWEWAQENQAARDKGGWASIFTVSTPTATTVFITAGAD